MATVAIKDFLVTVRRPKFWITSSLLGLALLLAAWAMTNANLEAQVAEIPPNPALLWHMGAEGTFVAWSFGILGFFLPLLPIIVVYDALREDRLMGFLETALARPVPRWSLGLGKAGGLSAALAIPVGVISVVGAALIQLLLEGVLPTDLILAVLGSALLLTILYVLLALLLAVLVPVGAALFALFMIWIASSAVAPGSFIVGGQFLFIVPIDGPQTYQAGWGDIASFTGYFTGLLALYIPPHLNFVVWPTLSDWPLLIAAWGAAYTGIAWAPVLLALYLGGYQRLELKRSI